MWIIQLKMKGRTLIKCQISSLSNQVQTLHSSAKWKNRQLANYRYLSQITNKPERVLGLQVRCRELDVFKIRNFLRSCLDFFVNFVGNFLDSYFFGRIFGRIFWEDFLKTLLKSAKLYESERNWWFCQDFGVIKKEGRIILNP